jgi:hypothetical protein
MKYIILIVVFNLLVSTCAKNEKCEMTLESASWLNWFGGIPNVGGTDYSIKFLSQECEDLKIDSVFIDGKSLNFKVKRTQNLWEIKASKSIKNSTSNRNQIMSKPTNTTITLSPIDARIVYSLNNRSSEIIIDRFTQGKDQFRQ